ncbi:DNA replication/repair protein RecF [Idiomarina xiamenensis]|uniref:DNA replication and repair protein RecF n=1 Tax=Idiomarina xiamenensis 10-D-4 TaxID=740709 RepID=K2JIW8_9GAMM|nr:DNA replication/repair protein RecF [Idiomarina xiamenensis]EKE83366.1 recombinational DNA repair ATPase [Idiomarina xiamenensis 10-D-4]
MVINELSLTQFRNFETQSLAPHAGVNLIYGDNGSGKTSLIEAIYCLGFGRSFRPGSFRQLVRHGADALTLFAVCHDEQQSRTDRIGLRRTLQGDLQLRINREDEKRFAAIARLVPVQLMTPESIELVLGGPKFRRQFIDWGVFHVEQQFYRDWLSFSKLLKQRNSLLKQRRWHKEGKYWDDQLSLYGERVNTHREQYVIGLESVIDKVLSVFLPEYEFKFDLKSGWDKGLGYAEAIQKHQEQDLRYGHTTVGPHKAEFRLLANGEDARNLLSRGQLKLLVAALKLVQGNYFYEKTGRRCIYLVDDLAAELDAQNQVKFSDALMKTGSQVFVTSISAQGIMAGIDAGNAKMFHVEHGKLKEDN